MTPEQLRQAFIRPVDHTIDPESELHESQAKMPAAVLVPLVARRDGVTVLLTQRSENLTHHPGQVSFPGGRVEAHDSSPMATALRETEEEIGLSSERIEVLGELPLYINRSGFRVTPVVGLVHPPFDLCLQAFEVADSFEVPLDFLMDQDNLQRLNIPYRGESREVYAIPYGERFIWGTTASILVSLYRFLHPSTLEQTER